ncbi:hypothetical protein OAF12_05145 [Akkermansiaceae bacterium]|nr:hypothetical protein [Akkermansiaceae bacterium]
MSDKIMPGGKFFRLRPEWLSGFQRATWHCRWCVYDRQQQNKSYHRRIRVRASGWDTHSIIESWFGVTDSG